MSLPLRTPLTLACALLCAGLATAQAELGILVGASGYEGELGAADFGARITSLRPSLGAYARAGLGDQLAARGYVQLGAVAGDDATRPSSAIRNLSFETDIFEVGAALEYYPLGRSGFLPGYLSAGASVYHFNPTAYSANGVRYELQPLGTEGQGIPGEAPKYALTRLAIPLGIGLSYPVGESFTVGAEFNTRILFFDYLDDVSGYYYNPEDLRAGSGSQLAVAFGDRRGELNANAPTSYDSKVLPRGNPTTNDLYYTVTVSVGYRFGGGGSRRGNGSRYDRCYQF